MATFANIVINDGQAAPVAHTFAVKSNDLRVTKYEDRVGGVPIGYGKLEIVTKDINKNNRRVSLSIEVPVLEAVSGANPQGFTPAASVNHFEKVDVNFTLNSRSTTQNRKDILAYAKNALALALMTSLVVDGEEISG